MAVRSLMVIALVACTVYPQQEITLSKDSLFVQNSHLYSQTDAVMITNHTATLTEIDSIRVRFSELDTTGLIWSMTENRFELYVNETNYSDSVRHSVHNEIMEPVGDNEYCIRFLTYSKRAFSLKTAGDSALFSNLRFGYCFMCASMPRFPPYFEGNLRLYFSNGAIDTLYLYTNDLRLTMVTKTLPVRRHTIVEVQKRFNCLADGRLVPEEVLMTNRKHIRHRMYELDVRK